MSKPVCPHCNEPAKRAKGVLEGEKSLLLPAVRHGPSRALPGGVDGEPRATLPKALRLLSRNPDEQIAMHKAIYESPDNDPRWEWYTVH